MMFIGVESTEAASVEEGLKTKHRLLQLYQLMKKGIP
jgi:hypothetical protein